MADGERNSPAEWLVFAFVVANCALFSLGDDQNQKAANHFDATGVACRLENDWTGQWYQSGLRRPINITEHAISTKGRCVERDKHSTPERLLFHQKTKGGNSCWRCLLLFAEHKNVLRYKETSCSNRQDNLEATCLQMLSDTPMITLFRTDGEAEACPVEAPASFTYFQLGGRTACRSRSSQLESCASDSELMFRYEACPELPTSESKEERIRCYGSWKAKGGKNFFVARLLNEDFGDGSDFRCFMYEKTSSSGRIGKSASSSCRDLDSIESATERLEYKRSANSVTSRCEFSHSLRGHRNNGAREKTWESLDADQQLHSIQNDQWIVSSQDGRQNHSVSTCITRMKLGKLEKYVVYTKRGCHHAYQCVRVHHRSSQVIEILWGRLAGLDTSIDFVCSETFISEASMRAYQTLILSNSVEQPCPGRRRRYAIEGCEAAKAEVSFGCTQSHRFVVKHSCPKNHSAVYNCHGHWIEYDPTTRNDLHYLIVKERHSGKKSCFVYTKNGEVLSMSGFYRHSCKRGIVPGAVSRAHVTYNATQLGECGPASAPLNAASATSHLVVQLVLLLLMLFCLLD